MIKTGVYAFIVTVFFFFNCKSDDRKVLCKTEDCIDTLVVVLCDVTRSVNTMVSLNVWKTAKEIFDFHGENTLFNYMIINDRDYNKSVLAFLKKRLVDPRPSDRIIEDSNRIRAKMSLDSALKFDSTTYVYQNTCITLALNTAHEYISTYAKSHPGGIVKLYILSDFIEDCDVDKRFGSMDLVESNNVVLIQNHLAKKNEIDEEHNLQKLGVKIINIFESENLKGTDRNPQTSLNRDDLKKTWRMIYQRFGYSYQSDSIQFSIFSIPGRY